MFTIYLMLRVIYARDVIRILILCNTKSAIKSHHLEKSRGQKVRWKEIG